MKRLFAVGLCAVIFLTGCIKDIIRDNDDRYMKPGALDSPVATNFDEYHYKFLDRYRVIHAWPVTSSCGYRSQSTKYHMGETSYGEVHIGRDIYEADGHTWLRSEDGREPYNFDSYVRPTYTIKMDERDARTGEKTGKVVNREQVGLHTMCFEAWVGTSHSIVFRLHKRNVENWKKLWTDHNPTGKWSQRQIGGRTWWAIENAPSDLQSTGIGGWFQSYLTPIGDTGYSIGIQLGATQESLKNPEVHAKFQAMFNHLVESVKIEPLTPAIEAEIQQLKTRAVVIEREDCKKRWANSSKPPSWCVKYLTP